ncbi:MAG: TIGR04338 family metallohydrolase [Rhodococcus sp. (in: high G+C Gram-positive bacteria)]
MTRDSQRSRVYDAEQLVRTMLDRADERELREITLHGSTLTLPVERRFASVESVQAYADAVLALRWVRATWPTSAAPVWVRSRAGTAAAHYDSADATIAIPLHRGGTAWALREMVVLHEIAHHLAPDHSEPAHGAGFVERYLALVTEIIGPEAGFALRSAMQSCSVVMT